MIDHVAIEVGDFAASRAFYEAALAPLGVAVKLELGEGKVGLGDAEEPIPYFWLNARGRSASSEAHLAFRASDRAAVDAFHAAALAAGGRDNGAPGLRPEYHPSYYGAFVLDPDGNNVEAVCHAPSAG